MSHDTENTASRTRETGIAPREHAELLTEERRRLALDALAGRTSPVDIGVLAAEIATREETPSADATTEVELELHHVHLPKLQEAGLVEYRPERKTVEPTGAVEGADTEGPTASRSSPPTPEMGTHVEEYFDVSASETASLDDLARYTCAELSGSGEWSAERIRLWLHHAVLPKLDADGVLDYRSETKMVRCSEDCP